MKRRNRKGLWDLIVYVVVVRGVGGGGVGRNVGNVMRSERVRDLMYIWREGERELQPDTDGFRITS